MSKLRPLVAFEITTTIKYLTIFYCIEFSMVAVTLLLTWAGQSRPSVFRLYGELRDDFYFHLRHFWLCRRF